MAYSGPSDSFRITPEIVQKLKHDLTSVGAGKWSNVYAEIQSDGKEIYISVELVGPTSQESIDRYKDLVMSVLIRQLPAKIEGEPCWIVSFKRGSEIVDTVDAIDAIYN